ncbi:MAG: FAD binding domain-containing protein [Rhodopila sp.]
MKPPKFDYLRAQSAGEVLAVLHQEGGEARVIAGGQSLMPMLNMRLARPAVLVDVMHVPEWQSITDTGSVLHIGAAVRQVAVMRHAGLGQRVPLLAAALPWLGHAQTRSRGTLCGSVAHADPSAEVPLVLTALEGSIHLRSRGKARTLPAAKFFTGMMATARADDEVIEAISVPTVHAGHGYAFREVVRRHGDFAIVGCAAAAGPDNVRLAVAGVADMPRSIVLAADPKTWDDALDAFAWSLDARDDLHATARYRRELVRRLGRDVCLEAQQCRA